MAKRRNIAFGTAVAAGLGYVLGILTAPKSGKETRRDIQTTASKAKTDAERNLKKLHSELDDLIKTGKGKVKTAKTTAKTELSGALAKAQIAKDKARAILSAVHEGDADDADLKKAITEAKKAVDSLKKYARKGNAKKKAAK